MNEENIEPCPHDLCDGTGKVTVGKFDDIEEKDCLCEIERKTLTDESLQDN